MVDKFVDVLKNGNVLIPRLLLNNYIKLNIKDRELIVLIYLLNDIDTVYNPNKISKNLNISINEILTIINSLEEKGVLHIEIRKIDKKTEEHVILDNLYEKLAFLVVNQEEEKNDIYSIFEKEFGRTLSPMEYEIISKWGSTFDKVLIVEALKEAVFNNVSSLKYVDKILLDWQKKGVRTIKEAENERKKFASKKQTVKQVFEYDWLNDKGNN